MLLEIPQNLPENTCVRIFLDSGRLTSGLDDRPLGDIFYQFFLVKVNLLKCTILFFKTVVKLYILVFLKRFKFAMILLQICSLITLHLRQLIYLKADSSTFLVRKYEQILEEILNRKAFLCAQRVLILQTSYECFELFKRKHSQPAHFFYAESSLI